MSAASLEPQTLQTESGMGFVVHHLPSYTSIEADESGSRRSKVEWVVVILAAAWEMLPCWPLDLTWQAMRRNRAIRSLLTHRLRTPCGQTERADEPFLG